MRLLKKGEMVKSLESKNRYKIQELLGEGGFGRAYRATAYVNGKKLGFDVCLKTTTDQTSWHRESYFGDLLSENKRVIQMYESFVVPPKTTNQRQILYAIVLELAEFGDLQTYLEQTQLPWSSKRAKREVIALLKMLNQLHGGNATHRDITPMNLFVCANKMLKLGDFGIARHDLIGAPRTLDAINIGFAPTHLLKQIHPIWKTGDDVYQMGQVLAMLVCGKAESKITLQKISQLDCEKELKTIIKKAIGPRQSRYEDAYEMMQALSEKETELAPPPLTSFQGKTVAFTGRLTMKRFDAEILVLQAGGTIQSTINAKTDIVVQGRRSPLYKKGHKGQKLIETEKLLKKGYSIHIIGEKEFRNLVKKQNTKKAI